ncbi:MAG: nuclear transport factor 2 family protein [Pedobacter sp.]
MDTKLEIGRFFSNGNFDQAAQHLNDDVEFHVYEDDKHLIGKAQVMEFCDEIAKYFLSVETNFLENGYLVSDDKVIIYGYAEFKRGGKLVNAVNSCDVYEFNAAGLIQRIHSYCNSLKQ